MESQSQNPEFMINPENFRPYNPLYKLRVSQFIISI